MSATRSRRRWSAAWRPSSTDPVVVPRWALLAAVLVVLAVQPILGRLDYDTQFLQVGVVDWTGHLATGLVLVGLLRPPPRVAVAILACSVLIDVDHLPAKLGTDVLTAGTDRPYTHSLLTVLVVLAIAAAARSEVVLGCAVGLAGHLLRDVGTGGDAGAPLAWPLSHAAAHVPFWLYVVVLALTAATAAARPTGRRTPLR
jgi:inner membrane protein